MRPSSSSLTWRTLLRNVVSLDRRSLAAWRVAMGAAVVVEGQGVAVGGDRGAADRVADAPHLAAGGRVELVVAEDRLRRRWGRALREIPALHAALGGDGESTVQIEVGQDVSATQEQEVLEEALKDAIEDLHDKAA